MAETSSVRSGNSSEDFVNLQDVLYSFNNSISEEQAWAVCYQCAQYLSVNSQDRFRDIYYYGITAIQVSTEGDVKIEINFNQGSGKGPPRKRSSFSLSKEYKSILTQTDAIQALGTAIYKALDYGLSENEEPHLSPDLESLIELMTDQPADDDEGIDVERDCDDGPGKDQSVVQDLIDLCEKHLHSHQNAQLHYKAVCRALATEAKELVTFLDNIASGQEKLASTKTDSTDGLDDLQRADWARLWVQIMRELRHGVMLKKVETRQLPPLNYELTPFEMLLEDIRSRRYKLNEIMVNGNIPPKVKNDAHAVILDFIRSRPPLKPVNKRVLKSPPKREMDSREMLMADIRKPHTLKPVRRGKLVVGARRSILDSCDRDYDPSSDDEPSPKPQRKVIKPVADFQVSTDDSDSYYSETDEDGRHHIAAPVLSPLTPVNHTNSWKQTVVKDMVSQPSDNKSLSRRHTISACDIKNGRKHKWQNPIECLSLTLEEVTHIRIVLTKAELESLITNHDLYTQVSKGKICFTCKKTKFSLFGQWGTKCKLCQRTVCNFCLRKMSVPTEHFEKIPVYTLSPVPISPEVLEALKAYESTGSVPHSPVQDRKEIEATPSKEEPATPTNDDTKSRRRSLHRSHTIGVGMGSRPPPNKALLKGPQMSICCDCKSMIMEIIRASRTTVSRVTNKDNTENTQDSPSPTPREVVRRPRNLPVDDRPRPRSMLATFASFNFNKSSSDS